MEIEDQKLRLQHRQANAQQMQKDTGDEKQQEENLQPTDKLPPPRGKATPWKQLLAEQQTGSREGSERWQDIDTQSKAVPAPLPAGINEEELPAAEDAETEECEVKEEKRRRIMEAAVDIFSGKLFHQVKMDEIASRACVGKGTLYLYFESKEELFRRSFQYAVDLYYDRLKEALDVEVSSREKLKKIVHLHVGLLQEHLKLIYLLVGQSMAPPLIFQEEVTKAHQKLLDLVEGIIVRGIKRGEFRPLDTGLAARVYLGGITAFLHDSLHQGADLGDGVALSETFAGLYFEGFNVKNEDHQRGLK